MKLNADRFTTDVWRSRLLDYATLFIEEALSSDLLPELERMIRRDFRGRPVIFEYDRSGALLTDATLAAVPPSAIQAYHAYFHLTNPLPGEVMRKSLLDRAYILSEQVGRERLERTEYFNDFLRPNRIENVMGFSTALEGFGRASFNIARSRREGDFTQEDADRLNQLRSFFRNATLLKRLRQEIRRAGHGSPAPGEVRADRNGAPVVPFPFRGAVKASLDPFLRERFGLSPRQAAVAVMLMDGKAYKEIAGELGISFETVSTHVKAILDRTGAESSRRLAALVRDRWGD
jgi:DNA-binding CsgD family transcriptional regulator